MAWRQQPFNLGSYAGAKVGQYTTLLEETATPSEDGRIHFAGEHTSIDFLGFMNGAVESGERVAAALLEA
jgi:monoamine oxidase